MILARIMSKEELELFQEKGRVNADGYEGERSWDDRNEQGIADNYSFMVLNNLQNTLLNLSSVIPYFAKEENVDNKYLVFFESDNIGEEKIFGAHYEGYVRIDEFDQPGIYGSDDSAEISIPEYSSEHFKILNAVQINNNNLKEIFAEELDKLGLLNFEEVKSDSNSKIFDDFEKWLEKNNDNSENKDIMDLFICYQLHIIEYGASFDQYYDLRLYDLMFEEKYPNDYRSLEEDLYNCLLKIKEENKIKDIDFVYKAGKCLQNVYNWYYDYCDDCYPEEYDEEYDEDYENDNQYDEGEEYELVSEITEEEIKKTISDTTLDREKAKQIISNLNREMDSKDNNHEI